MTLEEKVLRCRAPLPRFRASACPLKLVERGVARRGPGRATVFPQAIGLAAAWDTGLTHRWPNIISTEARAKYNDALIHPGETTTAHPSRPHRRTDVLVAERQHLPDPRWGRGQEPTEKNPYLTSRMGVAFVTGMQGTIPIPEGSSLHPSTTPCIASRAGSARV